MKLFKFWIGLNTQTAHYAQFKDADKLREYIKANYGNVAYGYQVQ